MRIETATINVTSDTTGAITVYSPVINGELLDFRVTATGATTTADWTVTHEASAESIWSQSNVTLPVNRVPRKAFHTAAGATVGASSTGGPLAPQRFAFGNERVKFVGAQVGDAKAHVITVRIAGSFQSTGSSTE